MILKDIKTERLTLRELTGEDWKNYLDHVTAADEIFIQYGYEPTEELLDLIREPTINVIYYSIIITDTDEMAGYIGIIEDIDSIEFYIFKEHRHNGFCEEALGAFMETYLSGEMTGMPHDMISAETLAENKASIQLLENAGFEKDALGLKLFLNKDEPSGFSGVVGLKRYVYRKKADYDE